MRAKISCPTLVLSLPLLLAACGGGGSGAGTDSSGTTATSSIELQVPVSGAAASDAGAVQPAFHMAPVVLSEPEPVESGVIHRQQVPPELAGLSTRHLTLQAISRAQLGLGDGVVQDGNSQPAGSVVTTYNPSQIRAAYGLPALPASGATPTTQQAAQMGAGQTIYLVDAYDDPNIAAELAAFNQYFALPACTSIAFGTNTSLPLTAAGTSGCSFGVAFATANGGLSATRPSYNSGWAGEIALDVEWAHATAPLARIVLVEAPDASSLTGAVVLANAMGPGVVSMSWGSSEGGYTASYDSYFSASGMTYLASAGDNGAAVSWPAVSPHVIAVGGTTLGWSGSGTRSESAWSGTGGGVSAYTALPSYQNSSVPGLVSTHYRNVTDVSFNADPMSGQFVAQIPPGSTAVSWGAYGGTSVSAPQWAGILASANALRTAQQKSVLGQPHALLYGLSASASSYAGNFLDVTQGSDGSCSTCSAKTAYDLPTGLGTPNVGSLLTTLSSGTSTTVQAPSVTGASETGTAGIALSFTVQVSAADAVSYALTGAPSGMSVSKAGVVSWASPVAGNYAVVLTATDTVNGTSGHGSYQVQIAAAKPPVVAGGSETGNAGTPLAFTATATTTDGGPVSWSLSGAPSGMAIGSTGGIAWPAPVAGSYKVTAIAKDTATGLSGQGLYTVSIGAALPPTISAQIITGLAGKALSFTVPVNDSNPLSFTLANAPHGMSIGAASGTVSWPSPVAGSYAVTIGATDSKTRLTGSGVYTVKISATGTTSGGPSFTTGSYTGVAGQPLTGSFGVTDAGASAVGIGIAGAPGGMVFSGTLNAVQFSWKSPVAGSYTLALTATDNNGATATAQLSIVITAH